MWGVITGGAVGWGVAALAVLLVAAATAIKYLLPAKWMRDDGVPGMVLIVGGVLGVVGFFVIPIVGLIVGFIAGVFLAELVRVKSVQQAWPTTVTAMKAAGLSMLIDLASVLIVTAAWVGALIAA
ncbi:MAG: uncharacterized protein QG597_835 [Actinomycetota bacterium]|nr:uncharacterized protein [Actinomycetota bacterium]